ncbi:hypothetical protein GCM10027422_45470 [Hymenobacter arcticus]
MAVAVIDGGRSVWQEGFGWANRSKGVKATPRTPFCLASLTKPFTTTLLMTLVAEGKLALDEPANTYLRQSPLVGTNGPVAGATVRRLGGHASGLPPMFQQYFQTEAALAPTPEALLHAYGELAFPPGLCYEYSNLGFAALEAIAARVTGTDFGTLLTRRVLQPLGMHDSFFGPQTTPLPARAVGYDERGQPIPFYTTATPSSGELYASVHDLARFAQFTMKCPAPGQARILADRWLDELLQPVLKGRADVAPTFGWNVGHLPSGTPVLLKNGGQPGVAALMYLVPSRQLACLVLTNRSNGRALAEQVCNQVLASYLPDWQPLPETADLPPTPFVLTSDFGGPWQGTLTDGGAAMPVRLHLAASQSATLALGSHPAAPITDMQQEGLAFTGTTTGLIEAPDALRHAATTLKIKVIPHEGKLVGRLLAVGNKPGFAPYALLPYVLTLHRP